MKNILTVNNIHCEACIKLITKKVSKVGGVESVTPVDNSGTFEINSTNAIAQSEIESALKGTEYTVNSLKKVE